MKQFRYELGCPDNGRELCKYAPQCPVETIHHLVPKSAGKLAAAEALADGQPELAHLIKRFINHWSNKVRVGRCLHDLLDTMPEALPSQQEMERRIGMTNTEGFRSGRE